MLFFFAFTIETEETKITSEIYAPEMETTRVIKWEKHLNGNFDQLLVAGVWISARMRNYRGFSL